MNIPQAIEFLENEKDGSNVYDMEAVIELLQFRETIENYLGFYQRCLMEEERDFEERDEENKKFYKGKIYEMELVVKDLKRILGNDVNFIESFKVKR